MSAKLTRLRKIHSLLKGLEESIESINQHTDGQAAAVEQISATMQEISGSAQHLAKMAEKALEEE